LYTELVLEKWKNEYKKRVVVDDLGKIDISQSFDEYAKLYILLTFSVFFGITQ